MHPNRAGLLSAITLVLLASIPAAASSIDEELIRARDEATKLAEKGRTGEAETLLRQSVSKATEGGVRDQELARNLHFLAMVLIDRGKAAEALEFSREAVRIWEGSPTSDNEDYIRSLKAHAIAEMTLHHFAEGAATADKILRIQEKAKGKFTRDYFESLGMLAAMTLCGSDYPRAEALCKERIEIGDKLLKPDNEQMLNSLMMYGMVLMEQKKVAEAEPIVRRAISFQEKGLLDEPAQAAQCYNSLGMILIQQDKYGQAEQALGRAIALAEKAKGREDPSLVDPLVNLAGCYFLMGDLPKVEPLHLRALAIVGKTDGKTSENYAQVLARYAVYLRKAGRDIAAEAVESQVASIKRAAK